MFGEFEILNNFLLNAHDSRTESRIYLKTIWGKQMHFTKIHDSYVVCIVLDFKELKQLNVNATMEEQIAMSTMRNLVWNEDVLSLVRFQMIL